MYYNNNIRVKTWEFVIPVNSYWLFSSSTTAEPKSCPKMPMFRMTASSAATF